MMTKDEIQRDIRDLTYQYRSLTREGSYKLAQIRKERIKKLKEQLKQLNKAKVQDSMDVLRLCGYTSDVSIQVGPWTIYQEGNEISVHRGGRAWAQGFKSIQEAKAWIQKKERWLETGKDEDPSVKSLTYKGYTIRYRPSSGKYYISSGPGDTVSLRHIGKEYANLNEAKYSISNNDECPTFTKGTTKDKTKVVGQVGSVKIYYDDNDDIYYVNQGGSIFNNPGFKTKQEAINYVVKNNTKDDDATEHGSIEQYGKGTETESMGLSDDPVLAQDAGSSNPDVDVKKVISQGGRTAYGIYYKGHQVKVVNTLEEAYQKAETLGKLMMSKDGGPGSGIKGHRTPKKEEPKKGSSSGGSFEEASYLKKSNIKNPEQVKQIMKEWGYNSKKYLSQYTEAYEMAKNHPPGSKITLNGKTHTIEGYNNPGKYVGFKIKLDNGEELDLLKVLAKEKKSKVATTSVYTNRRGKDKDRVSPNKDADPKVAEAQAIINLCGGIF